MAQLPSQVLIPLLAVLLAASSPRLAESSAKSDRLPARVALRLPSNHPPRTSVPTRRSLYASEDQFWSSQFRLPDPDGWVYSAVPFNEGFVIGGDFEAIGDTIVNHVARWDGSQWLPLGAGFDGAVLSLAIHRGELFASGRFDHSGAEAIRGIARWTGFEWVPVGGGLWKELNTPSLGATALVSAGDVLYAAGEFDRAGGIVAPHMARWDGSTWASLGAGLNAAALCLLAEGDSLFVGGEFDSAGTMPASRIAMWDGASWSALGGGLANTTSIARVDALARYRGELVAAGYFDLADGQHARNLASWNGVSWRAIGDPTHGEVSELIWSLGVHGDTLLVGAAWIHAWDGMRWINFQPNGFGNINVLCETPLGLVVGGTFLGYESGAEVATSGVGLIAAGEWVELQEWSSQTNGLGGTGYVEVSSLASYQGELVAAGSLRYAGTSTGRLKLPLVASWDGATWRPVGAPPPGNDLELCADGDTLYLTGEFGDFNAAPGSRFDGVSWSWLEPLAIRGRAFRKFRGDLYLAGGAKTLEAATVAGAHRWKREQGWEQIGKAQQGDFPGEILTLFEYGQRLMAGGSFSSISGVEAHGIAAWDGQSWSPMDAGLESAGVTSLCECDGVLYAGGSLRDALGYHGLMRWDGARWVALPGAPDLTPFTLACNGHDLYVGGYVWSPEYSNIGIIRWDGTQWMPVGSGVNDAVLALLVGGARLYVGGRFSSAGGKSSSGIAAYDLSPNGQDTPPGASRTGMPNPFVAATRMVYRLSQAAHVRAIVYDIRGRQVAVLEDAFRSPGTHDLTWTGDDDQGRAVPAGMYFVRIEWPNHAELRRVVRLQ